MYSVYRNVRYDTQHCIILYQHVTPDVSKLHTGLLEGNAKISDLGQMKSMKQVIPT